MSQMKSRKIITEKGLNEMEINIMHNKKLNVLVKKIFNGLERQ